MSRTLRWRWLPLAGLAAGLLINTSPPPEAAPKGPPRLEAVAETRLLMEGLNQANFRGLERTLKEKPADVETWTFARGQALLIAESGNLLMLRPPKNRGERDWMDRSTDLRESATRLARATGDRDYARSRAGMTDLANSCNRCHQTFKVPVQVVPFADPPERKVAVPAEPILHRQSLDNDRTTH